MKLEEIAYHVILRDAEIAYYDLNVANFQHAIERLPVEYPGNFASLRGATVQEIARAVASEKDAVTVGLVNFREQLETRIKSELIEREKAAYIRAALVSWLPEDQRESLLRAARQRWIDEQEAARTMRKAS